jgi:hypothetical protein
MKNILIIILLAVCYIDGLSQAVIRITAGTNLQTAINNATDGTTFLIEPGSYGTITIAKKVALIGTGYFLNNNPSAGFQDLLINPGSDQSLITGLSISGNIYLAANNVTLQRDYVGRDILVGFQFTGNGGGLITAVGGTILKQNYFNRIVRLNENTTNTLIKNNIIIGYIRYDSEANSGQSINNTIMCFNTCEQAYSSGWTMSFVNNIVASTCNYNSTGWYNTNNTFTNNIIKTTQFATNDASNKKLANFDAVFIGYPNNNGSTVDGRYQLLSTSPAKNAGTGGTDCGAFGGNEPYIIQGIPIGPNVLSVTAPSGAAAGQTISVQIQAKVQN